MKTNNIAKLLLSTMAVLLFLPALNANIPSINNADIVTQNIGSETINPSESSDDLHNQLIKALIPVFDENNNQNETTHDSSLTPENNINSNDGEDIEHAANTDETFDEEEMQPEETAQLSAKTILHIEPFAGTDITDLIKKLDRTATFSARLEEDRELCLAIIQAESGDRFFRRNCEYLVREASFASIKAINALLIIPQMLKCFNRLENLIISEIIDELNEDSSGKHEPLTAAFEKISMTLELCEELLSKLREAHTGTLDYVEKSNLNTTRRRISGKIPEILRRRNYDLNTIVSLTNKRFAGLLNQFEHHLNYCRQYHNFLSHNANKVENIKTLVGISQILKSNRDFKIQIHNFAVHVSNILEKTAKLLESRREETEKLASAHFRQHHKIEEYRRSFPRRDLDNESEARIDMQNLFKQTLEILQKTTELASEKHLEDIDEKSIISPELFFETFYQPLNNPILRISEILEDIPINEGDFQLQSPEN